MGGLAAHPIARDALHLQSKKPFCLAVRAGFAARGLTYALIGGIAIALAFGAGSRGTAPDQQGAMTLVASNPVGWIAIAVAAIGLAAYALWKLTLGVIGAGPEGSEGEKPFDRMANIAGGVVYIAFCALAVRVLVGSSGNQTAEQHTDAAKALHAPGGPAWVGGAGAVLIAICLYQIYVGAWGTFRHDSKTGNMGTAEHHSFMWMGRLGLVSRALVFGISGYFLIRTAVNEKVSQGIGLDGALAEVHGQPFGNLLLVLAGVGLLIFALFSFLEARHRRL